MVIDRRTNYYERENNNHDEYEANANNDENDYQVENTESNHRDTSYEDNHLSSQDYELYKAVCQNIKHTLSQIKSYSKVSYT